MLGMLAVLSRGKRRSLRGVPKPSVLLEFVRRPHESAQIDETAADHYSLGAVVPSKDEGAHRDSCCADKRINEEYLSLMCTKIIRLSKNDDIYDHVNE